jgi:hypothetical protein
VSQSRALRVLALLLTVGLLAAACGDDDSGSGTSTTDAGGADAGGADEGSSVFDGDDPCTLLTDEQASAMVGDGVTSMPTDSGDCEWAGDDDVTFTLGLTDAQGLEDAAAVYADDPTFESRSGIGDDAWVAFPGDSVGGVLVGDVAVVLTVVPTVEGTGPVSLDMMIGCLEEIVENL